MRNSYRCANCLIKGIKRLGNSSARIPKWKQKKLKIIKENEGDLKSLDNLTSIVSKLLEFDANVYEKRYEEIGQRLKQKKII
jgi:hypothetical protein